MKHRPTSHLLYKYYEIVKKPLHCNIFFCYTKSTTFLELPLINMFILYFESPFKILITFFNAILTKKTSESGIPILTHLL